MADAQDGDGAFADKFLVCAMSELVGSEVEVLTTGNERIRGILDTFNKQFAVVLKMIRQSASSEPTVTTVVIEKKHLISLKGKFPRDSTRSNFLDHAIASNQVNGLKEDADAELVPWEDDGSTSEEQVNLVLEESEPGWDSGNMISTFEKANPGKTSYLGMEQYTNVEVPELSESEVREISQIVEQSVPIDDDYREDDTRTEEEKFAAVERTHKTGQSESNEKHLNMRTDSRPSHPSRHLGSTRRRERYNTPRLQTLNFNRRLNVSPTESGRDYSIYQESQSARSSPYLKMSSPQPSNYYPRRFGRGSLRFSGGRGRYRGHPSLPVEIPRVSNQQNSAYYYNKSAKQSPIRRYELEMYDKQSVTVLQQPRQNSPLNTKVSPSNEQPPSDELSHSAQPNVSAAGEEPSNKNVRDEQVEESTTDSGETKNSQLNPMASAFVPTRHQSEEISTTNSIPNVMPTPSFTFAPLLQALPTPIAPYGLEPFGYDMMAANCAAYAAAQLAAARRGEMQLDGPPRKAIVSVNMPVVENPFLARPNQQQERKSRRFVLTSNETSTTIQVPSGGILVDNADTPSTSTDQQLADPNEGVVMAGTFSSQPQSSQREYAYQPIQTSAAFTMAPPGQQQVATAITPPFQYASAYYLINPAALAASGLFATQPTLYQSMPIMPSYPFCGYSTAPLGFVPLGAPFAAPTALQGQEAMMDHPPRRPRFQANTGRRFSESVVPGNRSSVTAQDSVRLDAQQQKTFSESRRGEENRRKTNSSAMSDGDSRRFVNRRRSGQDGTNTSNRHEQDQQNRRGSSVQQFNQTRNEHFRRNR